MNRKRIDGRIVIFIIFLGAFITYLYPFVYMITTSFKLRREYYRFPASFLVREFTTSNYESAFSAMNVPLGFFNSLVLALTSATIICFLSVIVSYSFSRLNFKYKYVLYMLILSTMFIPAQVTMIPFYLMISKVGLSNTLASVIIVYVAGGIPGAILLFTACFRALPTPLFQAAKIDGAGHWRSIQSIVYPLGRPIMAIYFITALVGYWNDLFTPLILLNDNKVKTIMIMMTGLVSRSSGSPTVRMAAMVLIAIPALIFYLIFQKYIVTGLASGSVK